MNPRSALPLLLLSAQAGIGQAPAILWQRTLGGTQMDDLRDVRSTADGGFILAGASTSNDGDVSGNHGLYDAWIAKIDSLGAILWQRSLGGSDYDGANAVELTTDGGYVIAGWTRSSDGDVTGLHGDVDGWVMKLDAAGTLLWQVALGGTLADTFYDLQQTADGGFIVVGESESSDGDVVGAHGLIDVWLVKLDADGALQWQQPRGGMGTDRGRAVCVLPGGGYRFAAWTGSNDGEVTGTQGYWDAWVVEVDSAGEIVWEHTLGGSSGEGASAIALTSDGGSIIAGHTASDDGDVTGYHDGQDAWVVKLDALGAIQWQRPLGGSLTEQGFSVEEMEGGYVMGAMTYSSDGDVTGMHGGFDAWVVALDSTGDLLWQKAMGGNIGEQANAVVPLGGGRWLMAGYADSQYSGDLTFNHGQQDGWLVMLGDSATALPVAHHALPVTSIHPNPAHDRLEVDLPFPSSGGTVELIDPLGRCVLSAVAQSRPLVLDLAALPRGLYTLRINGQAGAGCHRVVVE